MKVSLAIEAKREEFDNALKVIAEINNKPTVLFDEIHLVIEQPEQEETKEEVVE